ncbi:MAG: long-chain-fatty-acid--CoA ligase [Desulfobacteraceae bacterium]|nr:MAG: long-chain-fatty-acid--CoA ligase [Desulfobacteraceae bacterium]
MNVRDYIAKAALYFPENTALVDTNGRLTAKELVERIFRVSNALLNLGLKKGDRVAVLLHNCNQCVECFFGIQCAGLVLVPLNARNSVKEHHYILQNSEAKAILVGREFGQEIFSVPSNLEHLENFVQVTGRPENGFLEYEKLLSDAASTEPPVPIDEQDVSSLRYTSGTTGKPKGVIHNHRNYITMLFNILTSGFTIREGDSIALMGPVTHASGSMILPHILNGAKVIILSHFEAGQILELVQKERITTLYLVPTMIVMLLNHPKVSDYDLSSLRTIRYGASPISPDVLKRAIEIFGDIFIQGYGLTEGSMPVTILTKKDHMLDGSERSLRLLLSIGKETLAARVGIMDENGNLLSPGEVGEIVIQSDQNMQGYWKNPEATDQAFRYGWMHTRDMGYRDAEGYIYLVDRKEDMIISGGFNIYPKEVEDVLYRHPAVLEAAVFGVPDDVWGESVKAVVSLKKDMKATPEEIIEFCRESCASYKKPKSVEFVDELPKTAVGKISRKTLKEKYWKDKTRRV